MEFTCLNCGKKIIASPSLERKFCSRQCYIQYRWRDLKNNTISLHINIDPDTYEKLWKITKRRFKVPTKSLSTIVREALKQYIERELQT